MKIFSNREDGKSFIHGIRHNGSLWQLLYDFLQAYKERTAVLSKPPIGETSIAQKLDAIIEMLKPLGPVPATVGLTDQRLTTVHGLIFDLTRKVETGMATQEQRLQVIVQKIDEVLADLAALKANNPQIEDEIAAIEAKLQIAPAGGGESGGGAEG